MMQKSLFVAALCLLTHSGVSSRSVAAPPVTWKNSLKQPASWYSSAEAVRIADNVLLYQRDIGGWNKNIDMSTLLSEAEKSKLREEKKTPEATIDNGATFTQLQYLAGVYEATGQARFRDAFIKGLDWLLAAQYDNGGWPQYYPLRKGYYTHITFNDDAMVGVLTLLRSIARQEPSYRFVNENRRTRAARAVEKGIDCILKCQVVVENKKTVWCSQHDEKTFAPAPARAFEPVSLSGSESVDIVRFLMDIDHPRPEVIQAVEAAMAWFQAAKITGLRYEWKEDATQPNGRDRVVTPDPAAPPLWARFYEIGTNRPIFLGRDKVVKARLADIEHERRTGYAYYTTRPGDLLEKGYPAWRKRWVLR